MAIERPNQVWAIDITYIPMARGFVYLAVVLDWFSIQMALERGCFHREMMLRFALPRMDDLVAENKALIEDYNKLVDNYNELLNDYKELVGIPAEEGER